MARILVTTSRMPFALDEIRKFGHAGHEVYATDTFRTAPGSHSKYVREAVLTPPPRQEPDAFVRALADIVRTRRIDVLVPGFEDVFYIARRRDLFPSSTRIFAPPLSTLERLHDKARFLALAEELGLQVPKTRIVKDAQEFDDATREFGKFFARPVYSRGGVQLYTNTGPLAGAVAREDCQPSAQVPWVVQEFVTGEDVCSFSVAHHGHIAAHSAYVHPRMMEHAGGIAFESIQDAEALRASRIVVEACHYTGQISVDFMRTKRGLVVIECNPRPTAGVYVMPDEMFVNAVLEPDLTQTHWAPAGIQRKVSVALIRDMLLNWREAPADLAALFSSAADVYAEPGDLLPALYQFLSYGHVFTYRKQLGTGRHRRTDLMNAYFFDVSYDGQLDDNAASVSRVNATAAS